MAGAVALLVSALVTNPSRRVIEVAVGVAFVAGVSAVSTRVSLALLVFLLPFGVNISVGNTNMIFILFLALVLMVRRLRSHEPIFTPTPVGVPMLLLLGVHVISFIHVSPDDHVLALQKIFGLATAMITFYLVVSVVRDPSTLRTIVTASILSCAATCVVSGYELYNPGHSILPQFFYIPFSAHAGIIRAVGPFRNYSNFAQYLAMNMLIACFLLVRVRSYLQRWLLFLLVGGAGIIFLSSGMRSAFFAIVVAGVYVAVFGRRAVRLHEFGGAAALLAGLLAMGGLFMSSVAKMGTLFTRLSHLGLTGGSAESRWRIFNYLMARVPEHMVIGHGPAIRLPAGVDALGTNNPHNQYLYYLYTVGILGLVFFLWFIFRLAAEGHLTLVRTQRADPFAWGLLAILVGNLILFMLHEIADDYMFSPISMHVAWFYFGLLMATARVVQRTGGAAEESVTKTWSRGRNKQATG